MSQNEPEHECNHNPPENSADENLIDPKRSPLDCMRPTPKPSDQGRSAELLARERFERMVLRLDEVEDYKPRKPPMSPLDHQWIGVSAAIAAIAGGLILMDKLKTAPFPVDAVPYVVFFGPFIVLGFTARRYALPAALVILLAAGFTWAACGLMISGW